MKIVVAIAFVFLYGLCFCQDPWKNIYSQHAWEARDKWQKADELIRLMRISSGSRVADVGCHEGYMTFKLAREVGAEGAVYAVDVESGKVEKVRKHAGESNLHQVVAIKGDYDNPKLPLNALDAVIILDTYHEMDHHDEILQHIAKSLKTGGRLLICEPIAQARRQLSRAEQERKHELAIVHVLADVRKAGFKVIFQKDNYIDRTKEKGDKMWVIVAEKM